MFKKKVAVAALVVLGIFGSSGVFANNQNVGIGLGSTLLKGQKGKLMEIIAVTLNYGVCYNGLFAITFGTLGYKENVEIGMGAADSYIAENMDALAIDIAKGDGEYLDTLAQIMKVSDKDAFKSKVQENFDAIYGSQNVTSREVSESIKNIAG